MSVAWVDSHCHLQERYQPGVADDEVTRALTSAANEGVRALVCVGTDAETSRQAVELARASASGSLGPEAPQVRAVVGLHPHEATSDTAWIDGLLSEDALREGPGGVAGIGECGLDYFYEHAPRAAQRAAFSAQIAVAHEHALPLVIHARDAWDDLFSVLTSEGVPSDTVLHCFTGGPDEAAACLSLGMTISFSGIVTFKNATEVRAALAQVPLERLLVETDSPFLSPVPFRGEPNEPGRVAVVGTFVAEELGRPVAEVAEATSKNAARIFGF